MRRTFLQLAAWFAAGVALVLLASAAVAVVSRQVTDSRPAPLSADDVREELATARDAGEPSDATSTTAATVPTTTATTATTTPGSSGTPGTSPTTTPGSGSTTSTTATPPVAPTSKTYALDGGTATLRFSSAGVTVVAATPKAGFSVDVGETHGNGVRVEFESDDHRSRVDAWWEGGPRDEVREDD